MEHYPSPNEFIVLVLALVFLAIVPCSVVLCSIALPRGSRPQFFLSQIRIMLVADLVRDTMIATYWMLQATIWSCRKGQLDSITQLSFTHGVDLYRVFEAMAQVPDVLVAFGLAACVSRSNWMLCMMQFLHKRWFQVFVYVTVALAVAIPPLFSSYDMSPRRDSEGCWRDLWISEGLSSVASKQDLVLVSSAAVFCASSYLYVSGVSCCTGTGRFISEALCNMFMFLLVCVVRDVFIIFLLFYRQWFYHPQLFYYYATALTIWSSLGDSVVYSCQNKHIRMRLQAIFCNRRVVDSSRSMSTLGSDVAHSRQEAPMPFHVRFDGHEEVTIPSDQVEAGRRAELDTVMLRLQNGLLEDLIQSVGGTSASANEVSSEPSIHLAD